MLRIEPLSTFSYFDVKLIENNDAGFFRIILKVVTGLQLGLYLRPTFKYLKGMNHFSDLILKLLLIEQGVKMCVDSFGSRVASIHSCDQGN
jgi:hypothetical protein